MAKNYEKYVLYYQDVVLNDHLDATKRNDKQAVTHSSSTVICPSFFDELH